MYMSSLISSAAPQLRTLLLILRLPGLLLTGLLLASLLLTNSMLCRPAAAAPSGITYLGQLLVGGVPANGSYDFQFTLHNAPTGGTQVGSTVSLTNVTVADGIFYTELNFGSVFTGANLYLQTAYRVHPTSGSPAYTTQSPRKLIATSGYADYAATAGYAASSGSTNSLRGNYVSAAAPTDGQVLTWNASGSKWLPQTPAAGGGGSYTAGTGLTLSGSQFSVAAGGITNSLLASNAVTTAKIADGSVTNSKLANGSVTGSKLSLPLSASVSSSSDLFTLTNTGSGRAVVGNSSSGTGVYGSGSGYGVYGTGGTGVAGYGTYGVYGSGTDGIYGSGTDKGVVGIGSTGVYGENSNNSAYGFLGGTDPKYSAPAGVFGSDTSSSGGNGMLGISNKGSGVAGVSTSGDGLYGNSSSGYGVYGNSSSGTGVYGNGNFGLYGNGTTGVFGGGTNNGVEGIGSTYGVAGLGANGNGTGVYGVGDTGVDGVGDVYGVYGGNRNNSTYGFLGGTDPKYSVPAGVFGSDTSSPGGNGVLGLSDQGGGVAGVSNNSTGVYGYGPIGVYGQVNPIFEYGNYAGYFDGDVYVSGTLSKAGGSFKIDDPLDPAHKSLSHSFVESPDMKNIYDGTITTSSSGDATVTLPKWFEALNQEFRYQLTVVGQFAQAIVATKMHSNTFTIKTDKPNVEVCWQVTGTRHDAWANTHRIPVEEDKPADQQGLYLNPEAFGLPASLSVNKRHTARPTSNVQPTVQGPTQ